MFQLQSIPRDFFQEERTRVDYYNRYNNFLCGNRYTCTFKAILECSSTKSISLGPMASCGSGTTNMQEAHVPWRSAWEPTWPLTKVPGRCRTYTLSTPGGSKLSLSSLYQQWFPRYRPSMKIAIFGQLWNLAIGQSSRSYTHTLFLPHWVEIRLIFALREGVSEIRANFQNFHIWPWNLAIGQTPTNCTYIP